MVGKKMKKVKCKLCGENVPDDVELQQLHEKWYHYQEVIDVSGENLGRGSEYLIIVLSCQMERTLVKNSMVGLRMGKMGKVRRGLEEKRNHLRLPSSPEVGGK